MKNFLKTLSFLLFLFLISFAGDCYGDDDENTSREPCQWTDKTDIIFNEVTLNYPANAPVEFRTIHPDNPIKDLSSIVFYNGALQVTVFGGECDGSQLINYYKEDVSKIGISAVYDIPNPKNHLLSSVRVSVRSDNYYNDNMDLIYILWTKTVDPYDYNAMDNAIINGSMVPTSTVNFKNFKEPIYIDGQIKDQV